MNTLWDILLAKTGGIIISFRVLSKTRINDYQMKIG